MIDDGSRSRPAARRRIRIAAVLPSLLAAYAFGFGQGPARGEELMAELRTAEPAGALSALAGLRSLGVDAKLPTEILRDREDATRGEIEADKFLARLFDDGPSGVAEAARNQAVLAGANAALPTLERNLKLDFNASVAELGSFLRALDVFPLRDESTAAEARKIRSRLVAVLRQVRPYRNAIASDIDHGGGDLEPWALIEGGVFRMGRRPGQDEDRRPEIRVAPFRVLKHEVTHREFARLYPLWKREDPELPASGMTWQYAYVFAAWVGGPDAEARLPTEAEWEYAARSGGLERDFPWGDSKFRICERATFGSCDKDLESSSSFWNTKIRPRPPCSLRDGNTDQNVCDMSGNVSEWTADWGLQFGGNPKGVNPKRIPVIRGGDYLHGVTRVSSRLHATAAGGGGFIGFRIAVSGAPQVPLLAAGVASRPLGARIDELVVVDLRANDPGTVLAGLVALGSLSVDEKRPPEAAVGRFPVDDSERNAAVLAGAKALQAILEPRLRSDFNLTAEALGSVLWALDAYPMRDASSAEEARSIRSRLVEILREVRPFDDPLAYDIDHCGPDYEPWAMLEGGGFRFGAKPDRGEDRRPEVHVAPFRLLKHEVTVGEFAALFQRWGQSAHRERKNPAVEVSWRQAYVFAAWAVGPEAAGRLPTEAEWEYAARSGGLERSFPWRDTGAALCDRAWLQGCGDQRAVPHSPSLPVCSLPQGNTDQNVCDMAGNVSEWTADWRDGGPVTRGGDFQTPATSARTSFRGARSNGLRGGLNVGFRIAATAPPQSPLAGSAVPTPERLERVERLLSELRATEAVRLLEALAELKSLGADDKLPTRRVLEGAMYRGFGPTGDFFKPLFELAPADVAEPQRNTAVLAAAGAFQPILERNLRRDFGSGDDRRFQKTAEAVGSVLWALDAYPMRDEATRAEALQIRSRLVAALRRVRPFQDAIASDIDHGGGDTEPWAMIEGGVFRFGTKPKWGGDRRPEIELDSFRLLKHEVTNREFGRLFPRWSDNEHNQPARGMSWQLAYVFAAWAAGSDAAGRLPTEAEWEYAARSKGLERIYPWGDSARDVCKRARLLGCEGYSLHAGGPLPVCSLPDGNTDQNVCDMAGNAAEWTADWWEKRVPSGKNRLGVTPSLSRVPRGDMLVGDRSPCPGSRIGFRIALPVLTPTRD